MSLVRHFLVTYLSFINPFIKECIFIQIYIVKFSNRTHAFLAFLVFKLHLKSKFYKIQNLYVQNNKKM